MSVAWTLNLPLTIDAHLEPRGREEALGGGPDLEVVGLVVGLFQRAPARGGRVAILIGHLPVAADEGVDGHALEPADLAQVVRRREAVRVLDGIVEADGGGVVPRPADVAAEVALPAGAEQALAELVLAPGEEPLVGGAGIEHVALRAPVVVEVAVMGLQRDAALAEALRDLGADAALRGAGPQRTHHAPGQRGRGIDAPRARVDDAAEGVRTVGHRPGPARDLDAVEDERVQERRARPDAPVAGHACAVEQDERPPSRQSADRGHGGVALRHGRHAGDRLQRLRQVGRLAGLDLLRRQERRGVGHGGFDVRSGPGGDRDGLVHERRDPDLEYAVRRNRLDQDGLREPLAGQDDQDLERRREVGLPGEPAVGIRIDRARPAENRHLHPGKGLARALVDDPPLGGIGSCSCQEQRPDRGTHWPAATHSHA